MSANSYNRSDKPDWIKEAHVKTVDLHGCGTTKEALDGVRANLAKAKKNDNLCLHIIAGRGKHAEVNQYGSRYKDTGNWKRDCDSPLYKEVLKLLHSKSAEYRTWEVPGKKESSVYVRLRASISSAAEKKKNCEKYIDEKDLPTAGYCDYEDVQPNLVDLSNSSVQPSGTWYRKSDDFDNNDNVAAQQDKSLQRKNRHIPADHLLQFSFAEKDPNFERYSSGDFNHDIAHYPQYQHSGSLQLNRSSYPALPASTRSTHCSQHIYETPLPLAWGGTQKTMHDSHVRTRLQTRNAQYLPNQTIKPSTENLIQSESPQQTIRDPDVGSYYSPKVRYVPRNEPIVETQGSWCSIQ